MKKAILSLSGGLDSTCLLFDALSKEYEVRCYSFNYGQKHIIELEKVKKNIDLLKKNNFPVSHQIIDLRDCFSDSTSSLHSNVKINVPEGHYKEESMKSTVIENRNIIFAAILYGKALSWAKKSNDLVEIQLGIHAGDHSIYPDTTVESRLAAELCFKISNWDSEKVSYTAPFINLTKTEVLAIGINSINLLDLSPEIILSNTHTCYAPNEKGESCGKCGSCIERLEAFSNLNLKDPIKYQ